LWIQQDGIVAAHTDAAQTHIKNNYMRSPLATDVFDEELLFAENLARSFYGFEPDFFQQNVSRIVLS
jgi:hypothetical protein